jgi:hypothetical protein
MEENDDLGHELLRARLTILLLDELEFKNTTLEFQDALERRWEVKYDPNQINDELDILAAENQAMEYMANLSHGQSELLYMHICPEDY